MNRRNYIAIFLAMSPTQHCVVDTAPARGGGGPSS
jgi:hypothetical protein